MTRTIAWIALTGLLFAGCAWDHMKTVKATPGKAHQRVKGGWEQVAQTELDFASEKGLIEVTSKRAFNKVSLRVQRRTVFFQEVVVTFDDGEVTTVKLEKTLRSGETTPPIDVPGKIRAVAKVEFTYYSDPNAPVAAPTEGAKAEPEAHALVTLHGYR